MAVFGPWTLVPQPTIYAPATGLAIGPRNVEWQLSDVVGSTINPFSLAQQFYAWNQSEFQCSVAYAYLTQQQHFSMFSWLAALQGSLSVFPFGDPYNTAPQNPAATAPSVSGSGQSGYVLNITGGSNLTPGDWISIQGSGSYSTGSRLYMITSVASGALGIWPAIRESPTNGQTITISNCTGMFRLRANSRKFTQNLDKTWGLVYEIHEAL
jgi:hypothetical protein